MSELKVEIYRDGKREKTINSPALLVVGTNSSAMCFAGDIVDQIILITRVKFNLKRLIQKVINKSNGLISESLIEELTKVIEDCTYTIKAPRDNETAAEIIARLKNGGAE